MKAQTYLLDSSFLIDVAAELETGKIGPALKTLMALPGEARLFISPVTVTEILEGAEDVVATERMLSSYHHTSIGWQVAQRCALNQARASQRMGENDAWQAALAVNGGHTLVGHDHAFERRPWLKYLDHAKS